MAKKSIPGGKIAFLLMLFACFGCLGGENLFSCQNGGGTLTVTGTTPVVTLTSGETASSSMAVTVTNSITSTLLMARTTQDSGLNVTPINTSTQVVASSTAGTYQVPIQIQSNGSAIGTLGFTYQGSVSGAQSNSVNVNGVVRVRHASGTNFTGVLTPNSVTGPTASLTLAITVPMQYRGNIAAQLNGLPAGTTATWANPGPGSVISTTPSASLPVSTATTQNFVIALSSIPSGNANVTLNLTDGMTTQNVPITITGGQNQGSFTMAVTPTQIFWQAAPTTSPSYTVTLNSVNGWAGTVSLSTTGLSGLFTKVFTPNTGSVTLAAGEIKQVTLQLVGSQQAQLPTSFDFDLIATGTGTAAVTQTTTLGVRPLT